MKTGIRYILSFLLVLILFSGCKKYEDDDYLFTLRSVKNRLTNGTWVLKEFMVDGIDSTDFYNEIEFTYIFDRMRSIDSDYNYGYNSEKSLYSFEQTFTYEGQLNEVSGFVYFSEQGDIMQMTLDYDYYWNYNTGNYYEFPTIFSSTYLDDAPEWKIEKLTNKDFWLTTKYNGAKKYSMKLVKE